MRNLEAPRMLTKDSQTIYYHQICPFSFVSIPFNLKKKYQESYKFQILHRHVAVHEKLLNFLKTFLTIFFLIAFLFGFA